MRAHSLLISIIFLLVLSRGVVADWKSDIISLTQTPSQAERDLLMQNILRAGVDYKEITAQLKALPFPAVDTRFVLDSALCLDGVFRPYVVYIPPAYKPETPAPLLVTLHGLVGRKNIHDDPTAYAKEHEFTIIAGENGWIGLFPFGQEGATWWDNVGMSNIKNLIAIVKSDYNIDDDRVWMGGFSDGGSAAFMFAMLDPTDYAAFVALNGHMGVGSLDGDLPLYAPNLFNTPVYAVTTFDDGLYPSRMMRRAIRMAGQAGADILYREHDGGHDFDDYKDIELPLITRFLNRHERDPLSGKIIWETGAAHFGQCRWFSIDDITIDDPAEWHVDHNVILVDSTISIGFIPDYNHDSAGVKVERVIDGICLADLIGLEANDIIIGGNGVAIDSMADLNNFKTTLHRGDLVELSVKRGEKTVNLKGALPEPEKYFVFKRDVPSAKAVVTTTANTIDIKTSRVGAFTVYIHPDMFNLKHNIVIIVNNKVVYDARVEPDMKYMLENYLLNRDRGLLYVNEIRVEL